MGADSVAPFLERCKGGKGAYILCKTSNSGSEDFQMLPLDNNKPLFLEVARKIERWHVNGIGAVIGATEPDELEAATWAFYDAKKWVPFLVPGVGAQGGSAGQTARTLRVIWSEAYLLHRINSSSAIAYAYKKKGNDDPVGSALSEIARMNAEIGKI
jgi:orotidine-5'-phosphate decarboxylase